MAVLKSLYKLSCITRCPNDNEEIHIAIHVQPPDGVMIQVEQIRDYLDRFQSRKLYQEDITRLVAKRFKSLVYTDGMHLENMVGIECEYDGRPKNKRE